MNRQLKVERYKVDRTGSVSGKVIKAFRPATLYVRAEKIISGVYMPFANTICASLEETINWLFSLGEFTCRATIVDPQNNASLLVIIEGDHIKAVSPYGAVETRYITGGLKTYDIATGRLHSLVWGRYS